MKNILILISKKGGNTEKLGDAILAGINTVDGVKALLVDAAGASNDQLTAADGIIIGSPVYFGSMSTAIKRFIDGTYPLRGQLKDKVGAAFATADNNSGGKETTILSIIQAMLIHQMIIIGDPIESGGYYGITSVGAPGPEEIVAGQALGKRIANIVKRIANDK